MKTFNINIVVNIDAKNKYEALEKINKVLDNYYFKIGMISEVIKPITEQEENQGRD